METEYSLFAPVEALRDAPFPVGPEPPPQLPQSTDPDHSLDLAGSDLLLGC